MFQQTTTEKVSCCSSWTCNVCTLINSFQDQVCSACETIRYNETTQQHHNNATLRTSISTHQSPPNLYQYERPSMESSRSKRRRQAQQEMKDVIDLCNEDDDTVTPPSEIIQTSFHSKSSSDTITQLNTTTTTTTTTTTNEDIEVVWQRSQHILRDKFQISFLRNLQPVVVRHTLERKNSIVVMATGAGKSLCYQLPAVTFHGITLVVSPLIALMRDQVSSLQQKGIPAEFLASANSEKENTRIRKRLPFLKLLYCTPELIETTHFRTTLTQLYQQGRLSFIAIDEAHTLSSWGHDFRLAFRKLSYLRESFPDIPCLACTATATPKVIEDLRICLQMTHDPCFKASFNRPNISYQVRFKDNYYVDDAITDLLSIIRLQHHQQASSSPCSGIIYVHKRSDTIVLANHINQARIPNNTNTTISTNNSTFLQAAPYHAGFNDSIRKQTQIDWTSGKVQIAVATIAFGMGIDLPFVRYVVHWSIPKSIEAFYQESGRAGRDGKKSQSIVYYSKEDVQKFQYLIQQQQQQQTKHTKSSSTSTSRQFDALQCMVNYCIPSQCRRHYLLQHFGETMNDDTACNQTCDYCQNPTKVKEAFQASKINKDVATYAKTYRQSIRNQGQKWNGPWLRPHEEDEEENVKEEDDDDYYWNDDSLELFPDTIDENSLPNGNQSKTTKANNLTQGQITLGFQKASSILSKYEMLECQKGQTNGFHTFKSKRQEPITIPNHLRSKHLPDPLLCQSKQPSKAKSITAETTTTTKSKGEIDVELGNIQSRLAQIREARATRLSTTATIHNSSTTNSSANIHPSIK